MDMNNGVGIAEKVGLLGGGGQQGKNWDNFNSIINKKNNKNPKYEFS